MKKKELCIKLSRLKTLKDFNIRLEQYQSEGELIGDVLWKAFINNNIDKKIVADLGCGNGIFGIGALLLGAKRVYFVEIDKKALKIAKENYAALGLNKGVFVNCDVKEFDRRADTVIMNPPFGVQKEHSDKLFLEKAFEMSDFIYSVHKIESKDFIKKIAKANGFIVKDVYCYKFLIKQTYKFHKQKSHYVNVGCWYLRKEKLN